eukprot:m.78123 g.78123  ORF g.78123 m.78123 type:complete len:232 (-) comp25083_c0_seq1:139-834(-)
MDSSNAQGSCKCTTLSQPLTKETFDHILDELPRFSLQHEQRMQPTDTPTTTSVKFSMCADEDRIGIKWFVEEEDVRAMCNQEGDAPEVWTDSCVEFFCTHSGLAEGEYFNFEFSCIGTCLAHFGTKGAFTGENATRKTQGTSMIESIWRQSSLGKATFDTVASTKPWTLAVCIPKQALKLEKATTFSNSGIKFNIMKCGDSLPKPHWLTFHKVTTEQPDFHRPDAFRLLEF